MSPSLSVQHLLSSIKLWASIQVVFISAFLFHNTKLGYVRRKTCHVLFSLFFIFISFLMRSNLSNLINTFQIPKITYEFCLLLLKVLNDLLVVTLYHLPIHKDMTVALKMPWVRPNSDWTEWHNVIWEYDLSMSGFLSFGSHFLVEGRTIPSAACWIKVTF